MMKVASVELRYREAHLLRQTIIWSLTSMSIMAERFTGAAIAAFLMPKFVSRSLLVRMETLVLYLALANTAYCFISFLVAALVSARASYLDDAKRKAKTAGMTQLSKHQGPSGPSSLSLASVCSFLERFLLRVDSPSPLGGFHDARQPSNYVSNAMNVSGISTGSSVGSNASNNFFSLSATLGYHDSPSNRSLSTVYTRQQLAQLEADVVIDHSNGRAFMTAPPPGYDEDRIYRPGTGGTLPNAMRDGETALNTVKRFVDSYQRKSRTPPRHLSSDARRGGSPLRERYGGSVSPTTERRFLRQHHHEADLGKIFKRYDIEVGSELEKCELKLRIWLSNTIIRPLHAKIDELNALLAEKFPATHLRIGSATVEQFRSVLHSKPELCHTHLLFVLPYLRIHNDQNYLVQRITTLAQNVALADFKWNRGADEFVMMEEYDNNNRRFARLASWNEQLPTDSELVWRLFATYMDSHLSPSPLLSLGDAMRPFSNVYFVELGRKSSAVQSILSAFYIRQTSRNPPVFEFVSEGGDDVAVPNKDGGNLWTVMLLLIAHAQRFNNSRLSHLALSSLCLDQVLPASSD